MSLRNMAIYENPLTAPPTFDGSPLPFVGSAATIQNGLQLVCSSDTNFQTRRVVTFKSRAPSFDAKTKTWSKQKTSFSYVIPAMVNDAVVYSTIRIEVETHPAVDATILDTLLVGGKSLIFDSNVLTFLKLGSLD